MGTGRRRSRGGLLRIEGWGRADEQGAGGRWRRHGGLSMRTSAIVFLGGGRITSAMTAGLRLAGYREKIVVYERHPEKLRTLRRESRVETASDLKSAMR